MITVKCSQCGSPVKRRQAPVRDVLCMDCCTPTDVHQDRTQQALEMVEARLHRFDGAGGYDHALLSMTATTTRWESLAATAVRNHLHRCATQTAGREGIMFTGPTGIGKTHAAIGIARRVAQAAPAGVWAVTESELLDPSVAPWELTQHVQSVLRHRHCLLVDDIGTVARPADQVMASWKMIADELISSREPIMLIGTTNRADWAQLTDWMGAQTVSRLTQFTHLATTGWTDRRTGGEHRTWRTSLTDSRRAAG